MTFDALLFAKLAIFLFIVSSPFYDGAKAFSFARNDIVKLLLLLIVIGLAFVDLQLAILAAIAFFIILIYTLPNIAGPPPKDDTIQHNSSSTTVFTKAAIPPVYEEPLTITPEAPEEDAMRDIPQTMFEFPDTRCAAPVEANQAYMNDSISNHYLDEKIKPYEQFISQLTNQDYLEAVSTSAYLMPAEALESTH
jgi:hypothetical protein